MVGSSAGSGHRAQHLERRGPERGGGLLAARVEVGPARADRAHHDRDVEEGQRQHDRDARCRPGAAEPSQPLAANSWPNATPTTTVGSTNGTATSAAQQRPARERRAGAASRPAAGRPPASAAVASAADQSVNQSTRSVRGRSQHVEHVAEAPGARRPRSRARPSRRPGRRRRPPARAAARRPAPGARQPPAAPPSAAQPVTRSRHCRSHVVRFFSIVGRGDLDGCWATSAYFAQSVGSGRAGADRVDVHLLGQRLLELLRRA